MRVERPDDWKKYWDWDGKSKSFTFPIFYPFSDVWIMYKNDGTKEFFEVPNDEYMEEYNRRRALRENEN
ncbi:hypothetical protein AU106_gp207 [Sinorhizobium phage phiM9]|uniref:Uncharacterized protein n=1 Tax=Sinorhizobium phage phiM9 TaxID=1636182 RepID=A0A0F6R7P9_9CAUD|nr:hypothetical protein AU106_gp207 [Sinorhizobium phage phiM9]AKE44838.1 hypothetical protein Sm_phiM9_211 [Sinorhizobium phage phiM9]